MKTVYHCLELNDVSINSELKINIKGKFLKSDGKWIPKISVPFYSVQTYEIKNCQFLKKIRQSGIKKGDESDFVAYEIEENIILLFSQETLFLDLYNILNTIEENLDNSIHTSLSRIVKYQTENFSNYLINGN